MKVIFITFGLFKRPLRVKVFYSAVLLLQSSEQSLTGHLGLPSPMVFLAMLSSDTTSSSLAMSFLSTLQRYRIQRVGSIVEAAAPT